MAISSTPTHLHRRAVAYVSHALITPLIAAVDGELSMLQYIPSLRAQKSSAGLRDADNKAGVEPLGGELDLMCCRCPDQFSRPSAALVVVVVVFVVGRRALFILMMVAAYSYWHSYSYRAGSGISTYSYGTGPPPHIAYLYEYCTRGACWWCPDIILTLCPDDLTLMMETINRNRG